MNILVLDTSGPVCAVAILASGAIGYEARALNQLTHSRNLMPMVQEALIKSGVSLEQLDYIAAVVGPGSFTGVRIGVAAAQGIARGLGIPCIPVNALEMMARSNPLRDTVICPIRDARAGQVYGAAFINQNRVMEDAALKLDEYLDKVSNLGNTFCFLGDGAVAYGTRILEHMGERAAIAPLHLLQPGAAAAAVIASERLHTAMEPDELMPLYLRAPQAERLRAQKEQHD
ncbi:MAG: tRNA (adenosine(37)-N6)-threonylcarbamoyltransferase complex dimerization subunit type 1 TsaB [Clostridiales bacterium]|nr:tRNA (adenosine(37)-N6)-threonylcarbamoyltransferase complex dimerization subunit type 1 TsaB [Clostridiales bacterium]